MSKFITYIQLRAARHILNLGVRDIAKFLKVSKATISKTELGKTRIFLYKHSAALIQFFEHKNIIFPNEYSIRYICTHDKVQKIDQSESALTRFQLIAGRYILNINQSELANLINIDRGIITRAEQLSNEEYKNPQDKSIIPNLKTLFLQHNIEFPDHLSIFFKKYVDKESNK